MLESICTIDAAAMSKHVNWTLNRCRRKRKLKSKLFVLRLKIENPEVLSSKFSCKWQKSVCFRLMNVCFDEWQSMRRILNMLSIEWRLTLFLFCHAFAANTWIETKTMCISRVAHSTASKFIFFSSEAITASIEPTKWCGNWSITRRNYWKKLILWTGKLTIICTR